MNETLEQIKSELLIVKELLLQNINAQTSQITLNNSENIWKSVKKMLQDELTMTSYQTWIEPLKVIIKDNIVNIYLDSEFALEVFDKRYSKLLENAFNLVAKREMAISISTVKDAIRAE